MKPQSIKMFDRLFWLSIALGVVNFAVFYSETMALVEADPAVAAAGFGSGFVIATFVIGMAVPIILWAFISLRRSVVAKWILVLLTAFGVILMPSSLQQVGAAQLVAALVVTALQISAMVFLFLSDSKDWFERRNELPIDPTTFD